MLRRRLESSRMRPPSARPESNDIIRTTCIRHWTDAGVETGKRTIKCLDSSVWEEYKAGLDVTRWVIDNSRYFRLYLLFHSLRNLPESRSSPQWSGSGPGEASVEISFGRRGATSSRERRALQHVVEAIACRAGGLRPDDSL